jgi:hypothetical protein
MQGVALLVITYKFFGADCSSSDGGELLLKPSTRQPIVSFKAIYPRNAVTTLDNYSRVMKSNQSSIFVVVHRC